MIRNFTQWNIAGDATKNGSEKLFEPLLVFAICETQVVVRRWFENHSRILP